MTTVWKISLILVLTGLIGGFLYGNRNQELALPGRTEGGNYSLGFIADCLYGIAGAFVVHLIIPSDFTIPTGGETAVGDWNWIKIAALGFIGGYAGRAAIDRAPLSRPFGDLRWPY